MLLGISPELIFGGVWGGGGVRETQRDNHQFVEGGGPKKRRTLLFQRPAPYERGHEERKGCDGIG